MAKQVGIDTEALKACVADPLTDARSARMLHRTGCWCTRHAEHLPEGPVRRHWVLVTSGPKGSRSWWPRTRRASHFLRRRLRPSRTSIELGRAEAGRRSPSLGHGDQRLV